MSLRAASSRFAVLGAGPGGAQGLPIDEQPGMLQQSLCAWPLLWIFLKALPQKVLQVHASSVKLTLPQGAEESGNA